MKIFDLYNANLNGTKLIEASAGTGKTFTLSGLYIRYIVEKKLLPENILVLTFTKAATAELKTRLRAQLIECKNHLLEIKSVSKDSKQLFDLYEGYKSQEPALKYIELALICFDQASIFTINGFCQKVIDDYNSDCGSPVFHELIDSKQYVAKYVYEFWRIQQKNIPIEFLSCVPAIDKTITKISSLLNKSHYHQVKPELDWFETENLYKEYSNLKKKWKLQHEKLLDYILSGDFHAGVYKYVNRGVYNDEMERFFNGFGGNVLKFRASNIESKLGKNKTLKPMPTFFEAFEEFYNKIFYSYDKGKTGNNLAVSYMYECFNFVQKKLAELLIEQGKYDYSDQIRVVHSGIQNNSELVNKIANQWQCVMIDEFQDTDSMQLEVFDKCFNDGKHDLIYVGDPKQAIYDFRGADVFVYNHAKEQTHQQFNLATNWRSSDKMLAASNAMFDYENSFVFPWLNFTPSQAKNDQKIQLDDIYSSVALIDCDQQQRKVKLALEIKRFLTGAKVENKSIEAENCAILVNSNSDAIELYEFLLTQEIPVSLWSESGVFSTESAKQLYYLIRAINYPSKSNIFTTLHGLFFTVSLNQLQKLDSEGYITQFVNYQLQSKNSNIVDVVEYIFHEEKVYSQLLQRLDGERHYTDIQQLIELLQRQVDLGNTSNQLENWLALQIQQVDFLEEDDQRKRRIESDGKKISIMTIHKSKGLEFDHVFIPYADKITNNVPRENVDLRACVATHDNEKKAKIYWRHSKNAKENYERERRAEKMRNIYVAITRAKHRIYLGIDSTNEKAYAKLPISALINKLVEKQIPCSLIQSCEISDQLFRKPKVMLTKPSSFKRNLGKPQSIYSFSALSKKQNISFENIRDSEVKINFSNYFQFPKGAKSGTMQHEILENLNFDAGTPEISAEVVTQLRRNNYDKQWQNCLSKQIEKILNTQLWDNGAKLSEVQNHVDEMEFMLPIGSINNATISHWLTQHRGTETVFIQDDLQGFLTGFVDLVFEYKNKYYVVDYKSNYLGGNISNYRQQDLKNAIEHHYYDLQYLLYSIALVKYLKNKVKNYDYEKHFGGIAYIFTRGINGDSGQGVYRNKPKKGLIEKMLEKFDAS